MYTCLLEPFGKLQRLTVWFSRLTSIPFEAWTNRNKGLWWAHQRPYSKTSPSGACPHCDTRSLPPAFISTIVCGPRSWVSDPLIYDLRKRLKACVLQDNFYFQRKWRKIGDWCSPNVTLAAKWKGLTLCMQQQSAQHPPHPPKKIIYSLTMRRVKFV